jgi:hypothetical protein
MDKSLEKQIFNSFIDCNRSYGLNIGGQCIGEFGLNQKSDYDQRPAKSDLSERQ